MKSNALSIARYRFEIKLRQPLLLQPYEGAFLRSVFGNALRNQTCMTKRANCDDCSLRSVCPYHLVFEPESPSEIKGQFPKVPPPYLIESPINEHSYKSNVLKIDMVLFGYALKHLSHIVMAWQWASSQGFGKERVKGKLLTVSIQNSTQWDEVYHHQQGRIKPHKAELYLPSNNPIGHSFELSFVTPTRIQKKGKILGAHQIDAKTLINAIKRKVNLYKALYLLTHKSCFQEQKIEEISYQSELTRKHWSRYSARQKQSVSLDGLVGTFEIDTLQQLTYEELWLGQWTHVGKNTSFGLGQYQLRAIKKGKENEV